jgi:hypothetical protein
LTGVEKDGTTSERRAARSRSFPRSSASCTRRSARVMSCEPNGERGPHTFSLARSYGRQGLEDLHPRQATVVDQVAQRVALVGAIDTLDATCLGRRDNFLEQVRPPLSRSEERPDGRTRSGTTPGRHRRPRPGLLEVPSDGRFVDRRRDRLLVPPGGRLLLGDLGIADAGLQDVLREAGKVWVIGLCERTASSACA